MSNQSDELTQEQLAAIEAEYDEGSATRAVGFRIGFMCLQALPIYQS